MEAVKVENLSFAYPDNTKKALDDVSFCINSGSFTLLMGESGSGKTTLLKLLKKEIAPIGETKGVITISGKKSDEISFNSVGYVAQSPETQIITDKVWHELAFGLESMGLSNDEIRLRVGETASYFGIGAWYHRDTDTLSGGQKQLLNLASVMVMRPDILLLDEPTSQLDPISASDFLATLKRINRELGITVIISEHRLEEVFPAADRVIVLKKGKIITDDTPRRVCVLIKDRPEFEGLPSAVRIWKSLKSDADCPLSVKEGRDFLDSYYPNIKGKIDVPLIENGEKAIEFRDVFYRYDRNLPDVISGMNFDVRKGEIFEILGENGCGKSTILKVISGLCTPYSGSCTILGRKIKEYKGNSLYGETLAMLPQDPTVLFLKNTVKEDLQSGWTLSGKKESDFQKNADKWIDLFGIEPLLSRHPYDLSGGEQQRCALVKLLLRKPKILLLDEPTKGLDASFKNSLKQILRTLKEKGITIIAVTHDVEFAADSADRCGLLFDGKIIASYQTNRFFSNNTYYTTAASRIARGRFENAVRCDEIISICKGNDTK